MRGRQRGSGGGRTGAALVAASRNLASRHNNACQAVSPSYRHAIRTNTPTMATSGIEIVTGSSPVIPGATAVPAGSVAALTAHRRVVLRYGTAVTCAVTKADRRGPQRGVHLLPRPGGNGPQRDRCQCVGGRAPRPGRQGRPPTRGQIAAQSAAASVKLLRRSSRLTTRRPITTTAMARHVVAIRTRGPGHRASLPPRAAAEPPSLRRKALRS